MLKLEHRVVSIATNAGDLTGFMSEPREGHALILFAHGSGSSRLSPRNRYVAEQLESEGFGTLLFDLLTEEEDLNYQNRFDTPLLGTRLVQAVNWAQSGKTSASMPIGLFGASTGAAAALVAAAELGPVIRAVVSRGGRPDLAHNSLQAVLAPTLLIVGGLDHEVIHLNRQAMRQMPASTIKRLETVPGATHLFEEPGTLEKAAQLALEWFDAHARNR